MTHPIPHARTTTAKAIEFLRKVSGEEKPARYCAGCSLPMTCGAAGRCMRPKAGPQSKALRAELAAVYGRGG